MNERDNPDSPDFQTIFEDELLNSFFEKINALLKILGVAENQTMKELLLRIEAATDEESFIRLCDEYLGLSSYLIDEMSDQQERLRAQVGSFILNARLYLMRGMIPEYNETLENASLAAPNLEDRSIALEINTLFID